MVKEPKKGYTKAEVQELADKGKRLVKEALRLCIGKTGSRRGALPLLKTHYSPSPYQGEGDKGGVVTKS